MVKTRMAICALLLLFSFVVSLLAVAPVQATYGWDWGFGHASEIHVSDGGYLPNDYELAYVQWACNDIFYYAFAPKTYYIWDEEYGYWEAGPAYGHLWNYMEGYRSQTTVGNVLNGVYDSEVNHDESTFLYIGHMGYQYMYGSQHYGFVQHGYNISTTELPIIWDMAIYPYTYGIDGHHFVFLWVCRNGDELGHANTWPNPPNPPNGMPYCWTQDLISSTDGFASPDYSSYCLISFEQASPMLCSWMGTGQPDENLYKHWLCFFYYFALYDDAYGGSMYTVNDALDLASMYTDFPYGFSQSILYQGNNTYWPGGDGQNPGWYWSRMRVYGDGTSHLPGNIFEGGP